MKRPSKADAEFHHACRRALERYSLCLTRSSYTALCQQIRGGHGECLGRQSNRLSVWRVSLNGQTYPVVYDKNRHLIVTFLPVGIESAKGVSLRKEVEDHA